MSYFSYNKDKNLVNLSNSILRHFTGISFHKSLDEMDKILKQKPYQKIVVLLCDGMGKSIQEKHLKNSDFIKKHNKFEISSVFPPTTVAATNAFLSARYPKETGWLGWSQYFAQIDKSVDLFPNVESFTKESVGLIGGKTMASTYLPYENICTLINENSIFKADELYSFNLGGVGEDNVNAFFNKLNTMMNKDLNFIYAYCTQPDSAIHKYGINHPYVRRMCKSINNFVSLISKEHKDWLIIHIADHSLIDIKFESLYDNPDFLDTIIEHKTSLDSRSMTFFVKEGKKKEFEELFNKYYASDFKLFTKDEVISSSLFGEGEPHPLFKDFIGDYLITSFTNRTLFLQYESPFIGAHSGSMKEEFIINVSLFNE